MVKPIPPHRRKRLKIQKQDGTVTIALAAASQNLENDPWKDVPTEESRAIPVVVAAGTSRHKRAADGSLLSNISQDFDLSQPQEPEHWFPDVIHSLIQDPARNEPMALPPDATVDAVLESILVSTDVSANLA